MDDNDLIPNYYTNSITVLSFQWDLFTTIVKELFNLIKSLGQSVFYMLTLNAPELQTSLFQVFKAPIVALSRMALITGVGFLHLTRLSSLALSNLASFLLFTVALPITITPIIIMIIEDDNTHQNSITQELREQSLASGSLKKYNSSNTVIQSDRETIIETLINFHLTYNGIRKHQKEELSNSSTHKFPVIPIHNKEKIQLRAKWYRELEEKIDNYPHINVSLTDDHKYTDEILAAVKNHHDAVVELADKYFRLMNELCNEISGNKNEINNIKPDEYISAPPSNGIFM